MEEREKHAPLASRRREAFAQGLARGLTTRAAYLAAGYAYKRNATRTARSEEIVERVAEIKDDLVWAGSRDLAPVIRELVRIAKGANLQTAAGVAAATAAMAQVARLKERLAAEAAPASLPPRPALTAEEWRARYAPDT